MAKRPKDQKGDKKQKDKPQGGSAADAAGLASSFTEGFAESMGQMAAAYQQAMTNWADSWSNFTPTNGNGNAGAALPEAFGQLFGKTPLPDLNAGKLIDPGTLLEAQMELLRDYQSLWLNTTQRLLNQNAEAEPVAEPEPGDNRFKDPAWEENPVFDYIKQAYLLNTNWMKKICSGIEGVDPDTLQKVDFFCRQIVDALSPSNFALTNPVVLRETADTKGQNLVKGMQNFAEDLKRSNGQLTIRQTDMDAFEVGVNVAVTPGAVVFQNELFQLIQYEPTTEKVFKEPLLIIPPWINKFYILDLRPDNSFIKWAVDEGYTVFVMSWVNPDERLADKSFDDYIRDGIFTALDAVEQATGEKQVSAIGYCIGGTLLASALAYMGAHGDDRITAATFFAAQVDFTEAGELLLFTDPKQVDLLEQQVRKKGYLDGAAMAATFNLLRANDLIWYFMINNYLMGKEPPIFDLLFWNADSTRFPAQLLLDYLRSMYQDNRLSKPNSFSVLGEPVDLENVKIPVYIQASKEDHIAPATSVFKATQLYGGPKRFMLAGSGHIAGVINPPSKNKYQYWTNDKNETHDEFDAWFEDATETPGSWWPDWDNWLGPKSGDQVPARKPGDGKLKIIEAAPGSYVKVRS